MSEYREVRAAQPKAACEMTFITDDGVSRIGHSLRPARTGDTIEVPCGGCWGGGWVQENHGHSNVEWIGCTDCQATGTIQVTLTEDPHEQWVHEYGHHGWLIIGTTEASNE